MGDILKQVIIIRKDLGLSKGKMAAQAAHASLKASERTRNTNKGIWKKWMEQGGKKIILEGESAKQLLELKEIAENKRLPNSLIEDAGHTEISPGTKTALAIGPWKENEIDEITGNLETY